MVVTLTYQRCGSSFFGQLFNTNPDIFYLYEPLDALYTALYGTAEGWNVPSDITSFWNGTEREIPEREVQAVGVFLRQMLSCNLAALPTESMIHKYWYMFAGDHRVLNKYIKCIRQHNVTYTKCNEFTPPYCGQRFGAVEPQRMDECNKYLWNQKFRESSTHPAKRRFINYKNCLSGLRKITEEQCTHHFLDACETREVRAAKTVRATMKSMEMLLENVPNFRLIHLIRDPRGAILSRKEFDNSARGSFSKGTDLMAKEALLYCRTVVKDVKLRKKLEERFPGRIYPIIYDDFVKYPLKYTENIYNFVNSSIHEKTLSWIIQNTSTKKNSSNIASRWQDTLTFKKYKDVMTNCREFFEQVKYDWPMVGGFN
ncbi:hypothetical protein CAPTEDRAFT_222213 [Capitella teleta]|uniref:Sulfotransferase domain-containing protein n=1 Tax=Capitella teleta TaxID=283909 RepID=R7V7G5_CAPTE|nr:hypothetical protein CAPTEDRAFT_222213 [Capitella teleta]|eukprot:ELU14798.1 hypothetical protein CAPTEDRAFT_222213 [Capitella teleta]